MNRIKILDCTLRDGGYINNWEFSDEQIISTVSNLTDANINYIELGFLTSILGNVGGTQFLNIESASRMLPKKRNNAKYVVMADVAQFDADDLCPRSSEIIDSIRVVFYKRQIKQAYSLCEAICNQGYDLFLQPMVTIDYSLNEFSELIKYFYEKYKFYAVSIVDSFGCMNMTELHDFIRITESNVGNDVKIGFHGHDNMLQTQVNAISLFNYKSRREFIIDSSVSGMGRGAGNLCTELIAKYYNENHNGKYGLSPILKVASEITEPISRKYKWGYSPYFMLTAMRRAHPNFATYLLENQNINVSEFADFINYIPENMLTKCTRPYVEELYAQFSKCRMG
jgi:4-hydroxy 2-oxovalerate aldolase